MSFHRVPEQVNVIHVLFAHLNPYPLEFFYYGCWTGHIVGAVLLQVQRKWLGLPNKAKYPGLLMPLTAEHSRTTQKS